MALLNPHTLYVKKNQQHCIKNGCVFGRSLYLRSGKVSIVTSISSLVARVGDSTNENLVVTYKPEDTYNLNIELKNVSGDCIDRVSVETNMIKPLNVASYLNVVLSKYGSKLTDEKDIVIKIVNSKIMAESKSPFKLFFNDTYCREPPVIISRSDENKMRITTI